MQEFIVYSNEEEMDLFLREFFIRSGLDKVKIIAFENFQEYLDFYKEEDILAYFNKSIITLVRHPKNDSTLIETEQKLVEEYLSKPNPFSSHVNRSINMPYMLMEQYSLIPISISFHPFDIMNVKYRSTLSIPYKHKDKSDYNYYYLSRLRFDHLHSISKENFTLTNELLSIFEGNANESKVHPSIYGLNFVPISISKPKIEFLIKTLFSMSGCDHRKLYDILRNEIDKYKED